MDVDDEEDDNDDEKSAAIWPVRGLNSLPFAVRDDEERKLPWLDWDEDVSFESGGKSISISWTPPDEYGRDKSFSSSK